MAPKKAPATKPAKTEPKGRKPLAPAELVTDQLDAGKLAERSTELQVLAKAEAAVQALANTIGYSGPLDRDSLWSMVEYRQRRSVEDILEMGRGLLLIKEQSTHGEFQDQIAQRGIHYRTAARFMTVALKFSKSDSVSLLKAAGSQSKVLELAVLEDDELAALESGEPVAGITLDDVERMSASQLRAQLREARADLDAKDERISKLSGDLEKEHEKVAKAQRKWKSATPDEKQAALEQRIVAAKLDILAQIGGQQSGLIAAFIDLADHCNEHDLDAAAFMGDVVGELLTAVRLVRDDYEYGFAIPVVGDKGA